MSKVITIETFWCGKLSLSGTQITAQQWDMIRQHISFGITFTFPSFSHIHFLVLVNYWWRKNYGIRIQHGTTGNKVNLLGLNFSCLAIKCSAIKCSAINCSAIKCSAIKCSAPLITCQDSKRRWGPELWTSSSHFTLWHVVDILSKSIRVQC